VRQWARKFDQPFANRIRRRLPRIGDKWHFDEVALKIAGIKHWLWRAVDYGAAKREVMPGIEHRQHKGLNSRAENSHQPTRRRERQRKTNSNQPVRRSASCQPTSRSITFHFRRDHITAAEHRASRTEKFQIWAGICSVGQR
jgi:putative transposase